MKKYEGIFIIKPDLNDENLKAVLGVIEDEIKKSGKVEDVKSWGKKRLSYSIKKFDEGIYYKIDFDMVPTALREMERKFRLNDNIIRFMIISKES